MRSSSWRKILGTVLAIGLLTLLSVPAQAGPDNDRIFPEGWSIVFYDFGFFLECIDFIPCNRDRCPARAFVTGVQGSYTDVTSVNPKGRTSTEVVFGPISFHPALSSRKVVIDLDCSKRGGAFWGFVGGTQPPGSCGGAATYFYAPPLAGALNEGIEGITISGFAPNGGGSCSQLFGSKNARGKPPEVMFNN